MDDDFLCVQRGVEALHKLAISTTSLTVPPCEWAPQGIVNPSFRADCAAVVQAAADLDKALDVSAAAARTRREPVTYCGWHGASGYDIARRIMRQTAEVITGFLATPLPPYKLNEWLARLTPKPEKLDELRAAIEWEAAHATQSASQPAGGNGQPKTAKPTAKTPSPTMPTEKARQAYWTRVVVGDNQTTIARKMTENGVPANQGQVSRWLGAVDAFLAAGGIMPPVQTMHKQPQAMDPSVLDMGERQDGRTPRQRDEMIDPADDWD